jgi:hypothetical protein
MKRSTKQIALGAMTVLAATTFGAQAAPLFTTLKAAPAGLVADASYRALVADRATVSVQLVQADARQIDAKTSTIQLGLGEAGTVYLQNGYRNPDGTQVWYGTIGHDFGGIRALTAKATGEIADDPNNSVMIVRNGDKLTGTIRKNGELYALRPLQSGGHALVRIDESKMPVDHPAADYAKIYRQSQYNGRLLRRPVTGTDANGSIAKANAIIRVLVAYTPSAAAATGDIVGAINLAVAETNQGYVNSGVAITMQLAATVATTYTESGSFSTDLTRFRGTADGYMDSIHTTRNSSAADVGVLIINNSSACGLASGIGSTATTAFAAVHYSCATGYYSFGHEIGHLQSARHDPATDPTTTPYAYGHGYRSPTNAWRTIMAYDCTTGCPRINYWSNPAKTYLGQAMGTTTVSHNQRVLNNTAATVAAFR